MRAHPKRAGRSLQLLNYYQIIGVRKYRSLGKSIALSRDFGQNQKQEL